MLFQFLYLSWVAFIFGLVFAGGSMFSELEDFNDLGPSLVANENYQEIVPVPDNPDSLFNDDLFSVEISSSCLDDGDAAQSGKLRIRNLFCPAPELPINIPNILPSTEELHAMPPNVLDNQGDLTTTKSAGYFCVSSKYRADVRLGLMPVPVCGPASPLQQSSPGYGIQGYYLNVEFSRLINLLTPFCPVEDVFCCQFWRPYDLQRTEWNSPVDLGVGILCLHLTELGWTGYDEVDIPDPP